MSKVNLDAKGCYLHSRNYCILEPRVDVMVWVRESLNHPHDDDVRMEVVEPDALEHFEDVVVIARNVRYVWK